MCTRVCVFLSYRESKMPAVDSEFINFACAILDEIFHIRRLIMPIYFHAIVAQPPQSPLSARKWNIILCSECDCVLYKQGRYVRQQCRSTMKFRCWRACALATYTQVQLAARALCVRYASLVSGNDRFSRTSRIRLECVKCSERKKERERGRKREKKRERERERVTTAVIRCMKNVSRNYANRSWKEIKER